MTAPRISVVIPVFNTGQFLAEAIESVLAQGEQPLEIIVVDDGSTDDSAGIAESFGNPVRVIHQANSGHVGARNRGLKAARGQYIASLDADDLFSPDAFAVQAGRLDRHAEIDIVIGQQTYLRPDADTADILEFREHFDDHFSLSFACALLRREVFERVGWPDETMRVADDWDWFMRAREASVPLLIHRHIVHRKRLHAGNITRNRELGAQFTLEMMRRSLARRRQGDLGDTSLPPLATYLEPE